MSSLNIKSEYGPVRLMGTVLWSSFLWAGIATMLFFAAFDPVDLGPIATYSIPISPLMGYTLGFFGFWLLGSASSLSALFLLGLIKVERQ